MQQMTTTEPISRGQRKEQADGHRETTARDGAAGQYDVYTKVEELSETTDKPPLPSIGSKKHGNLK